MNSQVLPCLIKRFFFFFVVLLLFNITKVQFKQMINDAWDKYKTYFWLTWDVGKIKPSIALKENYFIDLFDRLIWSTHLNDSFDLLIWPTNLIYSFDRFKGFCRPGCQRKSWIILEFLIDKNRSAFKFDFFLTFHISFGDSY